MVVASRQLEVKAADGRNLEVLIDGSVDGLPLVFHSGTPSAALLFPPLVAAARERKLRTVVYSRPGYARSTAQPGRSVVDAVSDVRSILDAMNAREFVTIGWSGGGPHALACAARLADRCGAAVSLAGVAPYRAEGLDWLAGMGPENVEEFQLALAGERTLTAWLEEQASSLRVVKPADIAAALGGLVSDVDRASLTGGFAEYLTEAFHRAVSTGIAGWREDDLAFVRDWGFEVADIERPVAVWQGEQDRMVPYTHGRWLAEHIPTAQVRLYTDEGHLSLAVGAIDRIVDDLVALAR